MLGSGGMMLCWGLVGPCCVGVWWDDAVLGSGGTMLCWGLVG